MVIKIGVYKPTILKYETKIQVRTQKITHIRGRIHMITYQICYLHLASLSSSQYKVQSLLG